MRGFPAFQKGDEGPQVPFVYDELEAQPTPQFQIIGETFAQHVHGIPPGQHMAKDRSVVRSTFA
jgi:hypothetical protein